MIKNIKTLLLLVVICASCRTLVVNNERQIISDSQPQLGAIGLLDRNVLNRTFKTVETPVLKEKIRLELHKEKFDKKRYEAYLKVSPKNTFQISFVDSLANKPEFYSLQLSDRVEYIESIKSNEKLVEYLKNKPQLQTVTAVSIAVRPQMLSQFDNAESVFLVYDRKLKKYYLELMEKSGTKVKIYFNDIGVFAFDVSGFCWGSNHKHEVELKMLADGVKCSKELKRKAAKVNLEKDYLNF